MGKKILEIIGKILDNIIKIVVISVVAGFLLLIILGTLLDDKMIGDEDVSYDNTYKIERYNVDAIVNEDNVIDVTATIDVNFTGRDNHGIYYEIPYWNKYKDSEGKINACTNKFK